MTDHMAEAETYRDRMRAVVERIRMHGEAGRGVDVSDARAARHYAGLVAYHRGQAGTTDPGVDTTL